VQKHTDLTRRRLQKFTARLAALFYPQRAPLALAVYSAPGRISFEDAQRAEYRPAHVGEKFGPLWSTHWFRLSTEIPAGWQGREVHLLWDSSSEACVWQAGVPVQGLTGSTSGWGREALRKEFCLTKQALGGERLELHVEAACNGLFGLGSQQHSGEIGLLQQAEIAVFDRAAWETFWDFKVLADLAQHLPGDTPRGGQALFAANAMVNAIRLDDRATWEAARGIAANFFAAQAGAGQHQLSAIGHAHIDTAWLWPIAETKRKCARSFASAVRYMDDYAEYQFACSQAQQYEWLKDHYPALYERLCDKVRAGQFIPVGGTWIEPDCNLPSGESLVRQFLFGQRFFQKEFGVTCREFWNPDVFGYSGALPQIMRGAGVRYFLTQKLSWNQFNKPASHTFIWEGIDGSRVLTHFPPADTYNSEANVKEVLFNVSNFKDHERANESYLLFGYGDGGGGPTPAMLEQIRRMGNVDGLPRVQIRAPQEFFARCEADLKDPTVWVGELYFELHRGTYTTQARNKQNNRRCEFLLHDVEFLSAIAHATRQFPYPAAELAQLWKLVLTNQFHDILPGSSIAEVYEDSAADYDVILKRVERLRAEGLYAFTGRAPAPGPAPLCAAVNTLSAPRTEVLELPAGTPGAQIAANGKPLGIVSAPALGYRIAPSQTRATAAVHVAESTETLTLENDLVRATFTRAGGLVSLFDKRAARESIAANETANRFVLFDDDPAAWEAWDVDAFHLEKRSDAPGAHAARVTETGPLRAAVEFTYALTPTSTLTQTVTLTAISPRLDFETSVGWHEKRQFLKVEFPLNVRAANATYEIQFGHVQRPTHFNTSWDLARFEVCAHKWADLSEPGFGVAVLNDSKYGYAAHGHVVRLSLLRSPAYPDAHADEGEHHFRYALLPHAGAFQEAGVIEEAYRFNAPLLLMPVRGELAEKSFFAVDRPSVIIDTVKIAEDSDALIVRLYEAHGGRGPVRLTSPLPVQAVSRCNLLEEDEAQLTWADGVTFEMTPFQIMTLKLLLQSRSSGQP
jgi:alpha-mannosidase